MCFVKNISSVMSKKRERSGSVYDDDEDDLDKFQRKKSHFETDHLEFKEFKNYLFAGIKSKMVTGPDPDDLVNFIKSPIPKNADGEIILPNKFKKQLIDDQFYGPRPWYKIIGYNANGSTIYDNNAEYSDAEAESARKHKSHSELYNDNLRKGLAVCFEQLRERVGEYWKDQFRKVNNEFFKCWDLLAVEMAGPRPVANETNRLIEALSFKMGPNDRVATFLAEWKEKMSENGIQGDLHRRLLIANHQVHIRPLPARFDSDINFCNKSDYSLEQMELRLKNSDLEFHTRNKSKSSIALQSSSSSSSTLKVNSINSNSDAESNCLHPNIKCSKCNNYGHYKDKCMMVYDFCAGCHKSNVKHSYKECTKKDEKDNKSSDAAFKDKKKEVDGAKKNVVFTKKSGVTNKIRENKSNHNKGSKNKKSSAKVNFVHSDNECDDDDYVSSNRVTIIQHRINKVKKVKSANNIDSILADTGSTTTLIKSSCTLLRNEVMFNKDNKPPFRALTASDSELHLRGIASIDKPYLDKVVTSTNLAESLLGMPELRKKGCTMITPPVGVLKDAEGNDRDIGCIILSPTGEVFFIGDNHMRSRIDDMGTYNFRFQLPSWDSLNQYLLDKDKKSSILSMKVSTKSEEIQKDQPGICPMYGEIEMSVKERVQFLQRSFPLRKEIFMKLPKLFDNFPISVQQIKKHFNTDNVCWIKGHLAHRKVDIQQFKNNDEKQKHEAKQKYLDWLNDYDVLKNLENTSGFDGKKLSDKHMIPGHTVGMDILGPIKGGYALNAVDACTGYFTSKFLGKGGKANVSNKFIEILDNYRRFGHHSKDFNAPVNILKTDSDVVFLSKGFKKILRHEGIKQEPSPAYRQAYNGLIENMHKNVPNIATAIYCASNGTVSAQFWSRVFGQATVLSNLLPSRCPGNDHLSRMEDFEKVRPNFRTMPIYPMGTPIEYVLDKTQMAWAFSERSSTGRYHGVDMEKRGTGAILVWNPKTRETLSVVTYRILSKVPTDWPKFKPSLFLPKDSEATDLLVDFPVPDLVGEENEEGPLDVDREGVRTRKSAEEDKKIIDAREKEKVHLEGTIVKDGSVTNIPPSTVVPISDVPVALSDVLSPRYETRSSVTQKPSMHISNSVSTFSVDVNFSKPTLLTKMFIGSHLNGLKYDYKLKDKEKDKANVSFIQPPDSKKDEGNLRKSSQLTQLHFLPAKEGFAQGERLSPVGLNEENELTCKRRIKKGDFICHYAAKKISSFSGVSEYDLLNYSHFVIDTDRDEIIFGDDQSYGKYVVEAFDRTLVNAKLVYSQKHKRYGWRAIKDVEVSDKIYVSLGVAFHELKSPKHMRDRVRCAYPTAIFNDSVPIEKPNQEGDDIGQQDLLMNVCKEYVDMVTMNQARMKFESDDLSKKIYKIYDVVKCGKTRKKLASFCRTAELKEIKRKEIGLKKDQKKKLIKYLRKIRKIKTKGGDSPTMNQAKKRPDWHLFEAAIKEEMDQMSQEEIFDFTSKEGYDPKSLIGSMLVLQIQRNSDGSIKKYKARLVALGNQQIGGTFQEISSGTTRTATVKLLISLQAKKRLSSMVLDVKGAFLKTVIPDDGEKLFIRLPDGRIARLKKYLYGLKQSGYEWQQNLTEFLISQNFTQSKADPLAFYKRNSDNKSVSLCIHVDDLYCVGDQCLLSQFQKSLETHYGTVTHKSSDLLDYLGIRIEKQPNQFIKLSQPGYIDKILTRFNFDDDDTKVSTPMSTIDTFMEDGNDRVDITLYLQRVGALNFLAQMSRPDILYAISKVAQQCANPTKKDMKAVDRIFRYIKNTRNNCLYFNNDNDLNLTVYVDAAYNSNPDAKGHFGYSFSLGRGNGSFLAKSGKMKLTTLSSTEAEYVALCEAVREVVWVRQLLEDFGVPQSKPTVIYEDNKSCIEMVNGRSNHQASKHINPKFHFTRDKLKDGVIKVEHMPTGEMIADMLTKPLNAETFRKFKDLILNNRRVFIIMKNDKK